MHRLIKLTGIYSAVPTPFNTNRGIDIDGFQQLIEWQKSATVNPYLSIPPSSKSSLSYTPKYIPTEKYTPTDKTQPAINGFVVYGTTGESPTLSLYEKERLTKAAREVCTDRTLIIGVGSNCTQSSIEHAQLMREWGADAALVVTPYYNKPSAEGLFHHFDQIATAIADWPWILYVVPGRTQVGVPIDVIQRLLDRHQNLVAIKDASADLVYGAELISACRHRATVLSGDDPTCFSLWTLGAHGSISVASNLFPETIGQMHHDVEQHNYIHAREYFHSLLPIFKALFIESNPVPLKSILADSSSHSVLGCPIGLSSYVRPPLYELQDQHLQRVLNCTQSVSQKLSLLSNHTR
jgi:4-hydroxy-tetrahydrodipicolinate synthase